MIGLARGVLVLGLGLPALAGCQTQPGAGATTAKGPDSAILSSTPRVHRMVMFGSGPVYLASIPETSDSGASQVILEVSLDKDGDDQVARYAQDRHVTGESIYTLVSEAFVLSELDGLPKGQPGRSSFRASLVRGRVERGGLPFLDGVTVKVRRVVHFRDHSHGPTGAVPTLLVFGNRSELFVTRFDPEGRAYPEVAKVLISSGVFGDEQARAIRSGVALTLPSGVKGAGVRPGTGGSIVGEIYSNGSRQTIQLDVLEWLQSGF